MLLFWGGGGPVGLLFACVGVAEVNRGGAGEGEALRVDLRFPEGVVHQIVGPKKKGWHKLTQEQQPPMCSYQEYEDLAEVLMCEVELDNLHKEKSIELLTLESLVQHNVEVCTDKENGKKAMPCGWPCSREDAETSKGILEENIFQLGEKEQERMLNKKWKTHYHGPCSREEELQAFYMPELSEEELSPGKESDEEEDNDYYVDLTGLIRDLQAAERQEYGKSNLKSDDGFDEALKKHPAELQGLLRKHKVVFGPLMSPGSCKKLIQMDLEVTNEQKNSTLRSRPIPLNKEDKKETMRQIYECCDAKLMSRYEGKEFLKHCSPCFLEANPGSSAKRLVVHYAKLNERLKRHSGSIPNLERAIERAAQTKYKTKLDKRSGFWQIDLTDRAKELSAVIAPNGQVFRWSVMPVGLVNAPATFQEMTNQIVAIMKRRPKVRQLLRRGAVIEAYIDGVFLGLNTTEDHKAVIDEFLSVCDECNTRVKIEKFELMREVVEYLGFKVGYQWWKRVEDKVARLLKAAIQDHPVQGVKDIGAFIGSCNFYRRHIRSFTYSSVLSTNCTKKSEYREWTPAHQAEFEQLKSKLASLSIFGVPRPDGELVFISDASDEGVRGSLYQWQRINEGAVERIRSELKTAGIDRDGSLKHTYDCNELR